jgi:hypothetical protein
MSFCINLNINNIKHSLQMFAELNPKLAPMYNGVSTNRNNWQALAEEQERKKRGNNQG